MPGNDRILDPTTGDYMTTEDGSEYLYTDDIRTQVYHQVNTPYNTWPGDPEAGRKQTVDGTSAEELSDLRQSYLAAMQRLVDAGIASDPNVEVSVDQDVPQRVIIKGSIVDRQAGAIDISNVTRFKE